MIAAQTAHGYELLIRRRAATASTAGLGEAPSSEAPGRDRVTGGGAGADAVRR